MTPRRAWMAAGTTLLLLAAARRADESPLPYVDGAIAVWAFDEYGGDTTWDSTGNGFDGKLIGSVEWVDGMSGGASVHTWDKDGYIELSQALDAGGDWTLQAWSRFPLEWTPDGYRTLAQYGASHHHVLVDADGHIGSYIDQFYPADTKYSVNDLAEGWHLVSAVGSGGRTYFYIDAEQVGVIDVQETNPIQYIGNYVGGSQQWGTLDCMRFLKVARSGEDIAADSGVQAPLPTPTPDPILPVIAGTQAMYSLGEGTGNRTADQGPNQLHANLNGAPQWETGLIGTGLNFADYSSVATTSVDVGTSWTLQAWTRFPLNATSDGWRTLFQADAGHHHVLVAQDGAIGVFINSFHAAGYNVNSLTGWHLLSAVAVGGQTKFYIDNDMVGAADVAETQPVRYIGNSLWGAQNWGLVDCVRILNVARSDAEIVVDANPAPNAPAAAGQFTVGGTAIPLGGSVHGDIVVRAGVSEIISLAVKIQVEVKPVGTNFDGNGLIEGVPVASGATASVTLPGPANGDRRWRLRAVNAGGGTPSGWVDFGTSALNELDVRFQNAAPVVSSALQRRVGDGTLIPDGGQLLDTDEASLVVTGTDGDLDTVQVEIEIVPATAAFSGQATWRSAFVASGQALACGGPLTKGRKKWKYRLIDSKGDASAWTAHSAGAFDFEVVWTGSQAASGCLGSSRPGPAWTWLALPLLLAVLRRR